jgi:methylmalonyl-CoA mutase cobalamin-binding subunit
MAKNILCVPLDPVHDVGIKLIRSALDKRGYLTDLLSPDLSLEAITKKAAAKEYDYILVSRTIGYGVAELLGRFIDMLDAAGVRGTSKLILGGKAITPELAAELGFDKGFGEHMSIEDLIAYVEGRDTDKRVEGLQRKRQDISENYTYRFLNAEAEELLSDICDSLLAWTETRSTPGVERAKIRKELLNTENTEELLNTESTEKQKKLYARYNSLCDRVIGDGNSRKLYPAGVREVSKDELKSLDAYLSNAGPYAPLNIRHNRKRPLIFKFLGSGCPIMDLLHGKIGERWGIDGYLIINPSWEARYEGLLGGCLTHENDGTITSLENIKLIKRYLDPSTLLTVRAHRGLNTPETVLLAGSAGADLTKINLVYGSLGAGTDPERLTVDGVEAIRYAAEFNMPFDIPGNDELSGVPAWKTLAGLLINVMLGKKLGAKAILKPLFCYGPHIVLNGMMDRNFVDYNAAKIHALRNIVDCPVWPGEPVAFMTQTEERVQSANATSYHAALAATLGVDAITIASTDEAYSRGPIAIASRIDTIRAVTDAYRFLGDAHIQPTERVSAFTEDLTRKIIEVLKAVREKASLPEAIYEGILGNQEDGAYPGKFGKGSVTTKPPQI